MSEPLGPLDAIWLHLDAPENPMVVTAVLWFDAPLPRDVLVGVLGERLVQRYPRFRHRIVEPPVGPPWWEPDPAFSVERHVEVETLDPPGDRAALQALVSARMSGRLELDRAPWRFHLVQGYRGGSAVIARLHHSLADGITLSRILVGLTDGHAPAPP
ncbi:MAG: wax ester/triacylglycerol synthase family O-acyltransferase, partial [Alphaproteobacteria bacterium]|nr:wax ester/triacylglycerol synthase family O-acyltransferase [Alphaproteobacteria bacterium]